MGYRGRQVIDSGRIIRALVIPRRFVKVMVHATPMVHVHAHRDGSVSHVMWPVLPVGTHLYRVVVIQRAARVTRMVHVRVAKDGLVQHVAANVLVAVPISVPVMAIVHHLVYVYVKMVGW